VDRVVITWVMRFALINQIRSRLDENSASHAAVASIVADQALPWFLAAY
jgi:hypothetical protein